MAFSNQFFLLGKAMAAPVNAMRAAIELDALGWRPKLTLAVVLAAWTVTFAGLVHHLVCGVSVAHEKCTPRPEM